MFLKSFLFTLLFFVSINSFCQAYYDKSGQAILHFNIEKNTFFSYDGKPIFYLKYNSQTSEIDIYNFEGQHIGWYSSDRLYNHDGSIFLFTKNSGVNILYQMEPLKGLEQLQPMKKLESMPPIKPLFKNSVVSTYIPGTSSNTQTTNPYNRAPDYESYKTKGYQLPVNAILGAIDAQTNYQIEMMQKGYVLYQGVCITREEMDRRNVSNSKKVEAFEALITEANNNKNNISFEIPKKKSSYVVYFGNPQLGLLQAKVIIKKGGRLKGFYFNHPLYGSLYCGISKWPQISFPYQIIEYNGSLPSPGLSTRDIHGIGYFFWNKGMKEVPN